ncbi:hypothetical protein V8E36_007460 [Tilletia maclaganii]
MQFNKSSLLVFTTLALGAAVQGVAIQDPAARGLSVLDSNVALDARDADLLKLNEKLLEREPRRNPKAATPATVNLIKASANQVQAATDEIRRFRSSHKKAVKSKSKPWWSRGEVQTPEERNFEERAKKQNLDDLRKVNQHLLTAAGQLRSVRRREVACRSRHSPVVPIVTDVVPIVTDVVPPLPTLPLPTVLPTLPIPTDVVPTVTLPTIPVPTVPLPTTTTTAPSPTPTTPSGGFLSLLLAALRALLALIRQLVQEIVGAIQDFFGGFTGRRAVIDSSVLSEVSPGLRAIFSATSDLADEISPAVGGIVDPILRSIRGVLRGIGFTF